MEGEYLMCDVKVILEVAKDEIGNLRNAGNGDRR